jgi:hypothetical protein
MPVSPEMTQCCTFPRFENVCVVNRPLSDAPNPNAALFWDFIHKTCQRFPSHLQSARTDAALAVIELELPQWQLRPIAYDGGEWHCALSRHRELPDWLDQSIETHHTDLALALLTALMEAQQLAPASSRPSVPPAPRAEAFVAPFCCDNFA